MSDRERKIDKSVLYPRCAVLRSLEISLVRQDEKQQAQTQAKNTGAITFEIVIQQDARCKNKSSTFMSGALSETSLLFTSWPRMINNCRSR